MDNHPSTTQLHKEPILLEAAIVVGGFFVLVASLIIAISFYPFGFHWFGTRPLTYERNVIVDIKSLEGALADFKATFGQYPPSRITLYQKHEDWRSNNPEAQRSRAMIRRLWPQFDFENPVYPAGFFAAGETQKTLDGSECLVFFLGGVMIEKAGFVGFSKNPSEPFSPAGTSRSGPFFEFDIERLSDVNGNGLWEYLDPYRDQTQPYIYYTSYEGRGYDPKDKTASLAHYQKPDGEAWKPKSFQIISPGRDGEYGPGGVYDPETAKQNLVKSRETERDNITNFHPGRLAD